LARWTAPRPFSRECSAPPPCLPPSAAIEHWLRPAQHCRSYDF
jgi:hypothetical protein